MPGKEPTIGDVIELRCQLRDFIDSERCLAKEWYGSMLKGFIAQVVREHSIGVASNMGYYQAEELKRCSAQLFRSTLAAFQATQIITDMVVNAVTLPLNSEDEGWELGVD